MHLKVMIKAKTNISSISKKVKSFSLLVAYIFVLSLTSFHHHPINVDSNKNLINKTCNESSSFHYTAKDCPIINFANSGFNSFGISTIYERINHPIKQFILLDYLVSYSSKSIYINPLRGPPFSVF